MDNLENHPNLKNGLKTVVYSKNGLKTVVYSKNSLKTVVYSKNGLKTVVYKDLFIRQYWFFFMDFHIKICHNSH